VQNFEGIPFTGFVPPDTQGDVGPNHYIQVVNVQFQIFNKVGQSLAGPFNINSLWVNSTQQNCRNNNNGDPIVLYDHLADRWLLSQFAVPNGFANPPTFQCIAISQGPDPVNDGWHLYEFQFNFGHDYPKLGVWPDGYYLSSQQGFPGGGLNAVVFDRANMLNGNSATFQVRQIAGPAFTFLPSDLDGQAPPAGTPNYFARQIDSAYRSVGGNDRVEIWEFHVDWANPGSTTFTQTRVLGTIPFEELLCGNAPPDLFQSCVPQPNTTQLLATLTPWPMFRLQYRSLENFDTLVFNHTVNAGNGVAGVRWYELHTNSRGSGLWDIFQQGTFAPQQDPALRSEPEHRWMGSIAMDQFGNLAVGYSVSSENLIADGDDIDGFPSIRYAGRLADDPLGLLPHGEVTVVQGTGFQTGTADDQRWGDYSAMAVDPVDDCTFWYTQEYIPASGRWQTRIAAFSFDNCGLDLAIGKTASPDPATAGEQLLYTITVTNNGPLDATNVTVVDQLPAGLIFVTDTDSCVEGPVGTVTCSLGELEAGESTSFQIKVGIESGLTLTGGPTNITNVADVSADQRDLDEANSRATLTTIVDESADLNATKICKPDGPVKRGRTATCTIIIDNFGPSGARDVKVTDELFSNGSFEITKFSPSFGSCSRSNGTVTCELGDLDAGKRAEVEVVVTSKKRVDVNDVATVSSPTPDPNQANNQASGSVSFK
jgi:uncharacterized repeat protein (TIGR01451 family)